MSPDILRSPICSKDGQAEGTFSLYPRVNDLDRMFRPTGDFRRIAANFVKYLFMVNS